MFKLIRTRIHQGYKTCNYPGKEVTLHPAFKGLPRLNLNCDQNIVEKCAASCPQDAIDPGTRLIDLGRCVFCGLCERISKGEFIRFTNNFELAATQRDHLITDGNLPDIAANAKKRFKDLFGRSLQLRQVSAGGCNACEADTNVLNTPFYDLSRFGIQFVASPRHADGLHVTGPVTRNMARALLMTYEAVPSPKLVIAAGSCAISGGPFRGSPEIIPLETLLPVDLYIPGCPPHPMTTLNALIRYFKER
ncbi:MAG: hydrogenase [Dissulfurimicrobium sp.]|uniref:NADH-quinone oxidoreductase subunit B family protein n=1 Tax=Dissulfurimicrobium TaxID=1769732 RepID=UPI001EDAFA45|nr:hydrogenase [Dissulfurimicrobium hydrothermale]UKL12930.1 hydrogenase [Dissulfurimicrobium hydrothermale]